MAEENNAPEKRPPSATTLSYSRMRKYRDCRKAYKFHYVELIRKRGLVAPQLRLGSLVHGGMEGVLRSYHANGPLTEIDKAITIGIDLALANELKQFGDNVPEEIEKEVNEQAELAEEIVDRAVRFLELGRWEVVEHPETGKPLIEHMLTMPFKVLSWTHLLGYVDAVLRDKSTGCIYIMDHKCRKTFQSAESEETAEQFAFYQKLLAHVGLPLSGMLTFQIKNAVPVYPKMLKGKHALSKSRISTDWPTYLDAIEAAGLNPQDYQGVKEWASKKEFFRLTKNFRSTKEVENIWEEVLLCAWEMADPLTSMYRNLRPGHFGCENCDFRALCLGELRDEDTDWIRRMQYRHKDAPNTAPNPTDFELLAE